MMRLFTAIGVIEPITASCFQWIGSRGMENKLKPIILNPEILQSDYYNEVCVLDKPKNSENPLLKKVKVSSESFSEMTDLVKQES
jgi:hypothetical protein